MSTLVPILSTGSCTYNILCTEKGTFVNDVIRDYNPSTSKLNKAARQTTLLKYYTCDVLGTESLLIIIHWYSNTLLMEGRPVIVNY
jgi:hypothetical protein